MIVMIPGSTRRQFLMSAAAAGALRGGGADRQPVEVVSVPRDGIQPQVVLEGSRLHLVFFTGDARHGDVLYARSDDWGRAFSSPVRVNSQDDSAIAMGTIRGAQVALGKGRRVHVAWNGSDAAKPVGPVNPESGKAGSPMLYTRLNERGSTFEPQRNLMQSTFGLDGGGSVAADAGGNVFVAWHGKAPGAIEGEAGRQVWIAKSTDEGRSFAGESAAVHNGAGACGCCALRFFSDSRGVVYGLYRSATKNVNRDIYLLRSDDAGKTFSSGLLHKWAIDACPMSSMAFIETGGEVFGAWETQNQVYFAPIGRGVDAARSATIAPTSPKGAEPKRKHPALARNARGEMLLAWVEGSGWQRGGTLGWQIFDPAGSSVAACTTRREVPVWSFPAACARPDGGFTIIV